MKYVMSQNKRWEAQKRHRLINNKYTYKLQNILRSNGLWNYDEYNISYHLWSILQLLASGCNLTDLKYLTDCIHIGGLIYIDITIPPMERTEEQNKELVLFLEWLNAWN